MPPTWTYPGLFVLLWSTGFIGAKLGLPYAEPATFLTFRFLLVIGILLPLCWISKAPWPAPRRVFHIAFAGVLLQGCYLGGVFAAIHQGMPAGISALITGLQPLFTALLGGWLLQETISRRQWLGLALGLGGVVLVVGERLATGGMTAASVALAGVALASITLGTVWQKRHGAGIDLRTGAAIQFLAAGIFIAPFALAFESRAVQWTGEFVLALAWVVLALSLGAIFLLLHLIRQGAATRVAGLFYLVPPTTALMAWPLFGETYSLLSAAGMAVAVVAVWLVTSK
jgi:drug/metabolite transporter (DMT)-like permease